MDIKLGDNGENNGANRLCPNTSNNIMLSHRSIYRMRFDHDYILNTAYNVCENRTRLIF